MFGLMTRKEHERLLAVEKAETQRQRTNAADWQKAAGQAQMKVNDLRPDAEKYRASQAPNRKRKADAEARKAVAS